MKKICDVKPLVWNDTVVLVLSRQWLDCFGGIVPTFAAQITNDNKLRIESDEEIRND